MKKLTEQEINNIIKKNYGISDIISIEEINRGTADIYLIKTLKRKLIFKYFQDKYSQKEINREISIINFLNYRKILTPRYVETINGEFSIIYNDCVVIMQDYIEGTTKEKNIGNEKEMLDSAMYLGKMVKALEDFEHLYELETAGWFDLDSANVILKYKELLDNLDMADENASTIKHDLLKKIKIIQNLKDLDISDINKVSIKFTHGDYSVMQFIYDNNEIKAIIDFVAACDMPMVWEIIRSYSYIDEKCIDGKFDIDNLLKYVTEFQKYVSLNEYDLKFMPYIYLFQLLKSSFGYKQYLKNGNIGLLEFGIVRTKMCEYLFNHAAAISSRLLSEIDLKENADY